MLNITILKGLLHCSYGQPLHSEGFLVLIWCAIFKLITLKKMFYFFYDIDRTCLGPDDETGE